MASSTRTSPCGYTAAHVQDTQLDAAVALAPDLVTVTAGMTDLLRPRLDIEDLRATLIDLALPFVLAGARVVVVPIPDVSRVSAMGQLVGDRRRRLNDIYAHLTRRHGVISLPEAEFPVFTDLRACSADRLHLSPLGHELLALMAAQTVGVAVGDNPRTLPAGPAPEQSVIDDLI